MLPPFDREALKERNASDLAAERARAASRSPAEGLLDTLELSELVRELARASNADCPASHDLEAKADLYVRPLKAAR